MLLKHSNIKLALKNLFLPRRKNCIVLEPNTGLGDSLICSGLVKTIATRSPEKTFYYACLRQNFHSVCWMLQDLHNVFPLAVNSGREARQYAGFKNASYLPIGVQGVDIRRFDEFFYQQHQVPFDVRWDLANTPAGPSSKALYAKLNPKNIPYILVCTDDSSGEEYQLDIPGIPNLLAIKVHRATHNIFDWTDLVLGAQEIHTVDTAFIHLVENILSVDTSIKLLFHRIRQSPTEFTRRLPWQEILY